MISGNAGTTHLKSVTVTCIRTVFQITVSISHTVLNGYTANRTGLYLGEQIPSIICIIIGNASIKYNSITNGKFCSKTVCILITDVCVTIRGTVQDQVIAGPVFSFISSKITAYLNTRITIMICLNIIKYTVTSGDLNSLLGILCICHIKSLAIPVITGKDYACARSVEVKYRSLGI